MTYPSGENMSRMDVNGSDVVEHIANHGFHPRDTVLCTPRRLKKIYFQKKLIFLRAYNYVSMKQTMGLCLLLWNRI